MLDCWNNKQKIFQKKTNEVESQKDHLKRSKF